MRRSLLVSTFMLLATPAYASNWAVDDKESKLTFEASQPTETIVGSFKKFTPEIDFSEATPEAGKIKVTVDMASVDLSKNKDASDAIPTEEWFNIAKFPQAEFVSSKIEKTGNRQYAATGKLTIKGISKDVVLPFTLKPEGTQIRADGDLVIQRNDYKIGDGSKWSNERWLLYPVKVHYTILASPR